jgi:hypothetical protein
VGGDIGIKTFCECLRGCGPDEPVLNGIVALPPLATIVGGKVAGLLQAHIAHTAEAHLMLSPLVAVDP